MTNTKKIKELITERGLNNYLGEIVGFDRGGIGLDGMLLFGDVRDKSIVDDHFRKDRNNVYYVVGPTRYCSVPKGISTIGTKSRRYEAWNIIFKNDDIITVPQPKFRSKSYKVKLL